MLETCWRWHLVLLSPHLNLEAFVLNVGCFHLWPSARKAQQNFFRKPGSWEAALIKRILEGEHSESGLTLELWVQTLLGLALCEMINCCHFAMCNHHRCQGLQNLRTSRANSCGCRSASQQHAHVTAQVKYWAPTFLLIPSLCSVWHPWDLTSSGQLSTRAWENYMPLCLPDLWQLLLETATYKIPA